MEHTITTLVFAYFILYFIWFTYNLLTNKYDKNRPALWFMDGIFLWFIIQCPIFPWSVF